MSRIRRPLCWALACFLLSMCPGVHGQERGKIRDAELPSLELQEFLPPQSSSGNAALRYEAALRTFRTLWEEKDFIQQLNQRLEAVARHPQVWSALAEVVDGARVQRCDFSRLYPPTGDWTARTPNINHLDYLGKILDRNVDLFLKANQIKEAELAARALVAFGNHLRQSAFTLIQFLIGTSHLSRGLSGLEKVYTVKGDTTTLAQLRRQQENLLQANTLVEKKQVTTINFPALFDLLGDAEPIFRLEGLLFFGGLFNEEARTQSAADPNFIKAYEDFLRQREQVLHKIKHMAVNDQEWRVHLMAHIVLKKFESSSQPTPVPTPTK